MARIIRGRQMTARYWKGREVLKEYKQGRLVYEKSTSIPDYLCFTALEAGQFTLTIPAAVTPTYLSYIEWSKDGRTWNHRDNSSEAVTIDVQVAQGDKVYWRGSGNCMTATTTAAGKQSIFSSTARFDVSGYIMSLLKGDNFASYTHLTNYNTDGVRNVTFARLFEGSTTLVDASSLVLPTFTSWHTYIFFSLFAECTSLVATPSLPCMAMATGCYQSTFQYCSSLTTAPSLPATSLAANCYYVMFQGCSNLTEMPALPATVPFSGCYRQMFQYCTSLTATHDISLTSMASDCCRSMFFGCTSLTSAPDLKVAVLATNCYQTMFQNCTNLRYVKCLATDISATNCLTNWLNGVSSTGTFIQASGVTWPRGASGIPTGWLAYDEGEEIPNDYTPCDYIYNSSTGGGGVDLGFKFRLLDYSVEAKFKQDEISNGMVMGTNTNNAGAIWWYNYTSGKSFRINAAYSGGWKYGVNCFAPLDTDTHIIRYVGDADGCYQISDGTQSGIHDISTWAADESTDNLFIFGRAASTNTYKGRIYYLKVWNTATDEYICNLIPCSRNSDGAAGYWDTAQKKFFTSTYWTAHFDNE